MYLIRLLVVGDSSVGKTSLLIRFQENNFTPNQKTTIGVDYKAKEITIDGEEIKLQIWDTAGQERFRSMTSAFYNRAQGVIIAFDVSQQASFASLKHWIADVLQYAPSGCVIALCANKADLPPEKHQIKAEDYTRFAAEHGYALVEASAYTGLNVDTLFTDVARQILVQNRAALAQVQRSSAESIALFQPEQQRALKKSKCC